MNSRIRQILDQITALEDDLQKAIEEQHEHLRYQVEGKRITFEQAIREAAAHKMRTIQPISPSRIHVKKTCNLKLSV